MACAPSKDSDQPWHLPSLIRVFAVRMKKHWALNYPLSTQRRVWSDWADAQADLSLRCAHGPFCWFCHEVAHIRHQCPCKSQFPSSLVMAQRLAHKQKVFIMHFNAATMASCFECYLPIIPSLTAKEQRMLWPHTRGSGWGLTISD